MNYTIRPDGDLLRAHIWGRETDNPPSHICKAILEEGRKHRLKRILIALNQTPGLSPTRASTFWWEGCPRSGSRTSTGSLSSTTRPDYARRAA